MGAEEVVGPSPLLDARGEQGSMLLPNAPGGPHSPLLPSPSRRRVNPEISSHSFIHSHDTVSHMWCAELVLRIRKEVETGKLPADVAHNFENLFYNYKNAVKYADTPVCYNQVILGCLVTSVRMSCEYFQVLKNGDPNAHQIILSNMMDLFELVLLDVEVLPSMPVTFSILLSYFLLCSKATVYPRLYILFCRINLHFSLITRPSENHLTITLSVRTTLGHW
jgi:hypothetical protein